MRVAANIYLVASGVQGCSLTDDLDCNCWLFDAGGALVLFDTGAGADVARMFDVLREDDLPVEKLTHVVLTHAHGDHSGGACAIKQRTDCTLLCGAATADLLGRGEEAIGLAAGRRAGIYPRDYVYHPTWADAVLQPGATITIGNLDIIPIATPGHCLDHMSFLVRQHGSATLVTGDAMLHSGRIIYQSIDDFDVRQSSDSIRTLATLDFESLLPGHGMFVRHGGRRHVDAAVAHLDQLKTPRPVEFIPL